MNESTSARTRILNDDVLMIILKELDLNERTNLRLVSNQFKSCVDNVLIHKLVIYERNPCFADKFELTNERYSLNDTVGVYDLQKFFGNKSIIRCLRTIQKLKILAKSEIEIDLNLSFEKLEHLEIQRVVLSTSKVLSSPNLKELLILRSFFSKKRLERCNPNEKTDERIFFELLSGFDSLSSTIRHLRYDQFPPNDLKFFQLCIEERIFSNLQILEPSVKNLDALNYLISKLPKLKNLNIKFGPNENQLRELIKNNELKNLIHKSRKDLSIKFFGMPLSEHTLKDIEGFFGHYLNEIKFLGGCPVILINSRWNDFNQLFGDKKDLFAGFFDLISILVFYGELEDKSFYKMFNNLRITTYSFRDQFSLPYRLNFFNSINDLNLHSNPPLSFFDNRILDQIPEKCKQLQGITIHNFYHLKFDFLLKMPKLVKIILLLRYQLEDSLIFSLIKELKYLEFFEVFFNANYVERDDLSRFKKSVLNCLDDLKIKNAEFKIEIHQEKAPSFQKLCRYIFIRKSLVISGITSKANPEHVTKMFECLKI